MTEREMEYFKQCASSLRAVTAQAEALAAGRVANAAKSKAAFFHSLAGLSDRLGLSEADLFRQAATSNFPNYHSAPHD